MPQRDILTVGIRIGALVVFLNTLLQIPMYASALGPYEPATEIFFKLALIWGSATTIIILICVYLWFNPQSLIPKDASDSGPAEAKSRDSFQDLHVTLISTLGIYFFVTGLIRMIDYGGNIALEWIFEDARPYSGPLSLVFGPTARTLIGLYLIIGAQSIVRTIRRVRRI